MMLAELEQSELASYLERLAIVPFDHPGEGPALGPTGELAEQCSLRLELDGARPLYYRFSRLEAHALDLSNRLVIADELLAEARARALGDGFPRGYRPAIGDVLVHKDQSRYRVDAFTSDGKGVEVSGIDTPLLFYIAIDALTSEFVGLERRSRKR